MFISKPEMAYVVAFKEIYMIFGMHELWQNLPGLQNNEEYRVYMLNISADVLISLCYFFKYLYFLLTLYIFKIQKLAR